MREKRLCCAIPNAPLCAPHRLWQGLIHSRTCIRASLTCSPTLPPTLCNHGRSSSVHPRMGASIHSAPPSLASAAETLLVSLVSPFAPNHFILSFLFGDMAPAQVPATELLHHASSFLLPSLPCPQSIDMFGKRVGFVKFTAHVVDVETGSKVGGWVGG